jgi:hypothetical protein
MAHHFDTPTAREDPRINLCDVYLFSGTPGTVTMALTVNPDAGVGGPNVFREEGLYVFRFDLNDDAREEVTFKIRFDEVTHAAGDQHRHVQSFEVRQATGQLALRGAAGDLFSLKGALEIAKTEFGIRAFAGLAPDLFAGDAAALGLFRTALSQQDKVAPEAFQNRQNFFAGRNVSVIVLEVPSQLRPGARLGHGFPLWSCAGSPGISFGSSSHHQYFHAGCGHEGSL